MTALLQALREALTGRYTVECELGRGGMATVYLAHDVKLSRTVAIKTLDPDIATKIARERFLREIEIASNLQHPNILTVHDSGTAAGMFYYVMPYVEGESLRQRLDRETQLPVDEALAIAREVADALGYAHSRGVVHRDIKPGNILLSGGHALVADFGIARAITAAGGEELTQSGVSVGTPAYMSPEQADGTRQLDARADIYALGCVLYEMLVGEPPFTGPTAQVIIARAFTEAPPSLRVARPTVPEPVERAVAIALAKAPADRFSTAARFVEALSAPPRPDPSVWRRHAKALATAAAALVAVGIWQVADGRTVALDANKVVVFPLAERGRSGAGDEVALLIGSALEHTEPLQWYDGWKLLDASQRSDVGQLTARVASRISRDLGARYYVDGSIVEMGDSATVILWLTDIQGDSVVKRASAAGSTRVTSLPELGLQAVTEILPHLVPPGGRIDLTMLAGRRPAAVAIWLQGEREYRGSNFGAALGFFRRAVAEDSALAAAALRGAQAAAWENENEEAATLAGVALRHVRLLPSRHANFARGLAAHFAGQADSAVMWLTRALREAPDWTEAHMTLGEVYYHELPNASGSLDSLAAVEFAAAAVDTGFSPARYHLAEIAILSGNFEGAAEAIADFARSAPDAIGQRAELALMLQCAAQGPDNLRWPRIAHETPVRALWVAKALAVAAAFPACAEEGFRAILGDTTIALNYRWGALVGLQSVLAAQNRLRELRAVIDSAIDGGLEYAGRLYLLDVLAGLDVVEHAAAVATAYERGTPGRSVTPSVLWLLGTWRAQTGAVAKAESLQAVLAREAARTGDPNAARYANALGARLALQRGDTAAVGRLRALLSIGSRDPLGWGLGEPLAADRLLLAEFLLAHGRLAEALAVASVFDHPSPITFLPFLPASLALRREVAAALGRADLVRRFEERLTTLGRGDLLAARGHIPSRRTP